MYIYFVKSLLLCHLQKCIQVSIVAVNASVREQSVQMKCGIVLLGIIHSFQKCFILEEITILDLFGDTGQLLVYDTACTHIHMSNLRVTHLSIRKSYCQSTGISFYIRILSHQFVHHRGIRLSDRIGFFSVIQSIAI